MTDRMAEKSLAFAARVASEQEHFRQVMQTVLTKLETSMLSGLYGGGGGGENAVLTPEEALLLYEFTETHGLIHEGKRQ